MKTSRKGRYRLVLDLPEEIYFLILKSSRISYTTMTTTATRAFLEKFHREGLELTDTEREYYRENYQR